MKGMGWFWPRSSARRAEQGLAAPTAEARSASTGPGAAQRGSGVSAQAACRGTPYGQQQGCRGTLRTGIFGRGIEGDHAGVMGAVAVTLPNSMGMRRRLGALFGALFSMRTRRRRGCRMGMFKPMGMRACVLMRLGLRPHLRPPPAQRLVQRRRVGMPAFGCWRCVHVKRAEGLPLRHAQAQTWQQRDQAPGQPTA